MESTSGDIPTYRSGGLHLRPLTEADAADWFRYVSLDRVARLTGWYANSIAAVAALIRDYTVNAGTARIRWAIAERPTNRLIGTVGLHNISAARRYAEIAYDLAPEYWGQGIMSGVCREVIVWSIRELRIKRMQATVLVGNRASISVLQKCGFVIAASTQRKGDTGAVEDCLVFELLVG